MKLGADGIVTDAFNQALFILRSDTFTWAPPGGAVEQGELPTRAAEREIEEETGIKVRPVRLVAMYYRPQKPDAMLLFSFRCIQRGGELKESDEARRVGFLPVAPPPSPMLDIHRERLQRALSHYGGPPYWGLQPMPRSARLLFALVYRFNDLLRLVRRQSPFRPAPEWQAGAFVVLRDEQGRVLWVKRNDYDAWNLPGGGREKQEPPWETAIRETREETGLQVELKHLSGVYAKPEQNHIIFTFTATVLGGRLQRNAEAAEFAYFAPGEEPENCLPKHVERVADATSGDETTIFREQPGPSGIEQFALA